MSTEEGFGTWQTRIFGQDGKYRFFALAAADDQQDANDVDVLDFFQAQGKARKTYDDYARGRIGVKDATVAEAVTHYLDWYREHRKAHKETEAVIKAHILPVFGDRTISSLRTAELKEWRDRLATRPPRRRSAKGTRQRFGAKPQTDEEKRARRASANRVLTVFKAMLNKAVEDELTPESVAWKSVKPFKNADAPRVRFLTEAESTRLVPAIGFHELRHTYASLLAQAGADLLTISKLLGHADTRVTSRHYAHLCDRTLANAVSRLLPSFGHKTDGKVRAIR